MRKLKLELETLRVESFDTSRALPAARGTVRGRDVSNGPYWTCDPVICQKTYMCPSHHQSECCAGF